MGSYSIDIREVISAAQNYEHAGSKMVPALVRAINATGTVAGNVAIRETARRMGLNVGETKTYIRIKRASFGSIEYDVTGAGRPISLRAFGARQLRTGVSARPWGQRRLFRGAFIVPSLGGSVYHRFGPKVRMTKGRYKGKLRQAIRKMWGPAIPKVMLEAEVTNAFNAAIRERLPARLDHEIAFALSQLTRRAA